MKRHIITIDEELCNGCGLCVPDCPEGALLIIDGKARLVSDLFCDGLGACMGTCPEGALSVEEREAGPYDEAQVMANVVKHGENVIRAHLKHLDEHGETGYLDTAIEYLEKNDIDVPRFREEPCGNDSCGCAGSAPQDLRGRAAAGIGPGGNIASELRQWPVQLKLHNPRAPYFDNAGLLIAADCAPFAFGNFHQRFIKDSVVIMFCPKLDPCIEEYIDKLAEIIGGHEIRSITVVRMEVPCCGGIHAVLQKAMEKAGRTLFVKDYIISVRGDIV